MRNYTEESGLQVIQVFEGQDVMPTVHKSHPQVVLLQLDLPGQVKSTEILHALHSDPTTSHIPVLVFSWRGAVEGLAQGAVTHLQEPVTYETFVDALEKVGVSNK